jgi:glutathione S-transferase
MKLYNDPFAPSPRRVRMFLAEKGIDYERIDLSIAEGETRRAEFLAINPLGEVPVLELDSGQYLTESLAICRFLEAEFPEPPLLGRTALERAVIDAAVQRIMFRAYVPSTLAFRHTHKFWQGRIEQVPQFGAIARQQVLDEWQLINQELAAKPYLAGDDFSFADIVAFTTLDFGKPSGIRMLDEQIHLKRWYAEVAARPSAKA